jgi:Rad3-related DNA helicase
VSLAPEEVSGSRDAGPESAACTVSVRTLCEFAAKSGDLDLRFTPSPTAQQGREGHALVASRRGPEHESEVSLSGGYLGLRVRGRADGFDAGRNILEEVKTFRGSLAALPANHQALHWAQLRVYGWLMCQSRGLSAITLSLVYLDVVTQVEHPLVEETTAPELEVFFQALCQRFLDWSRSEALHRARRDAALAGLAFPQDGFRPGQHTLAAGVYRACMQSRPLLVQAPTGIGKTIGTLYPALRAMPGHGGDKLFFLTAKTPGRAVALEALASICRVPGPAPVFPLRVVELVARDKACEYRDKACHGQSCPLAAGFYDRLAGARRAAAQAAWLDAAALRRIALAHAVCPYYLGQEMVRWSDVVVGDYNYYFDRSAMLHALAQDGDWRVTVLVDEAHNLYSRACSMYSADLTHAETLAVRAHVPARVRGRLDELLNQWQLLAEGEPAGAPDTAWRLLERLPEAWLRAVQKFNSGVGEHLQDHPAEAPAAWLPFYFRTLGFAAMADSFGEHSLCEWDGLDAVPGRLVLRNVEPAPFIAPRMKAAGAIVLFSATLHPPAFCCDLLGLPQDTIAMDIPCPFRPEQLAVRIVPISTRRDDRAASLDALVGVLGEQFARQRGNYLAYFSSFDYLELALAAFCQRFPEVPVWSQQRQMAEAQRQAFLRHFDAAGQGIGFAVLGGAFGEGVDLPGRRLIGAFIATLGLPQFDAVNAAICARLEARFGRGHDYTYVFPGIQKVVQAAGRVIRTDSDTGCVILLDDRYRERRYRRLLPGWWGLGGADAGIPEAFMRTTAQRRHLESPPT